MQIENAASRFTGKSQAYASARPGYPPELAEKLRECGAAWAEAADIGAGTGLFTRLLLGLGCTVCAVEPNDEMRAQAQRELGAIPGFSCRKGAAEDTGLPDGYNFTDLELKLYESIVRDLLSVLGGSWENYIDLAFKFRRVETNPTLVQLIGVDETVVIIGINIKFSNCSGQMNFCLPASVLSTIFTRIAAANQAGRGAGEDNSEEILDILKDSELDISAEL